MSDVLDVVGRLHPVPESYLRLVEYVFDKRDRRFHTITMGFPDERQASFQTFEEMLSTVLREQQVA